MEAEPSEKSVSKRGRATPKFKIVFVGDQYVGKTSIITRFVRNEFNTQHIPTIGIDFVSRNITLENGTTVKLHLWDTAGQERFKTLIPGYLRNSQGVIIVVDISDDQILTKVNDYIKFVKESLIEDQVVIIVVGNKIDLDPERTEKYEELSSAIEEKFKAKYFEVSAKTGANLDRVFGLLASELHSKAAKIQAISFAPTIAQSSHQIGQKKETEEKESESNVQLAIPSKSEYQIPNNPEPIKLNNPNKEPTVITRYERPCC